MPYGLTPCSCISFIRSVLRREDEPDQDREDDDRHAVGTDHIEDRDPHYVRVDEGERRLQRDPEQVPPQRVNRLEDVEWGACQKDVSHRDQGTGSYPPAANGWQRAMRAAPIHPPLSHPYRSIASYV